MSVTKSQARDHHAWDDPSLHQILGSLFFSLLTYSYLCSSLPVEHRQSTTPPPPPPLQSVLGCSCHSGPVGPLLFQLCFSVLPPTVPLPLRVPGQGLVCGAGCWLPEGVSDPAPLPPQYLLGHWFLSRSFPQIFIPDLLLPLDFVDAPQTGVEECLDLSLHHLCCPQCLTSVEQDWLHIGVEDAELGSMLIPPDAQMILSMTKAALALSILAVTSQSVPPWWSTTLLRWTKDFTSLMGSPPTVTGVLAVVFIFISSVFFLLILSPVPADVVSRRVVLSCIWLWLCDKSARSSVKLFFSLVDFIFC